MNTSTPLSQALGRVSPDARPLTLRGRDYPAADAVLDLCDVSDLEDEIGDIALLDVTNVRHLMLLLWVVLRKSDPRLTEAQKARAEYLMTVREAGRLIPPRAIGDPEVNEFVYRVMVASGLMSPVAEDGAGADGGESAGEAPQGNAPEATGSAAGI